MFHLVFNKITDLHVLRNSSVSSKQVLENFDAIHSLSLPKYKNKKELIQLILKLKNEKKFSQNISRKSLK